ncbi:MAG: RluA family pseudouridine synthase [Lachnospiraceae bacterium]|nr:RluA family pseudouridine synthase [Lachnospiraceae bacterium]
MKEIIVGSNEAGQRMTKLLKKYLKEASDGFLYKMLRKKNITLNQKKADGKEILQVGDCIRLYLSDETLDKFRGVQNTSSVTNITKVMNKKGKEKTEEYLTAYRLLQGISIIFENDHLLLLNKPVGILSQKSEPSDLSLNEWVIGYLLSSHQITNEQLQTFRPSICNRLDRNTSGLVIAGKTYPGLKQINQWIQERKIKKYYRCFILGELKESLKLKGYLEKDLTENKVKIIKEEKEGFAPIETYVEPLRIINQLTYAEVELVTGKTHQIRAHLSSIGYPLLGDLKYGKPLEGKYHKRALPKGQLLHSYRVVFPKTDKYPDISGKEFLAPEPQYFIQLKSDMKKEE